MRENRRWGEELGWKGLSGLERWPLLAVLMWIATREPLKTWGAADGSKSIHHLDAELAFEAWGDGSPTKEWRGPHNSLSEAWNSELKVKLVGPDLRCRAERIPLDDSSEQPAILEFPLPGSGLEPLFYYVADQDGVPILLNGVQPNGAKWRNPTFDPEQVIKIWAPLPWVERDDEPPDNQLRGKQPRILSYLQTHFPEGVPPPGLQPRKELLRKIEAWDATLRGVSDDTLQRAIQRYARTLKRRNAPQ